MADHQLKEGEEIDLICWQEYGDLSGALEAVLRKNWEKLHLFDDLGKVKALQHIEFINLPELNRPTTISDSIRVFD